jgi:chemotaxis protein methyltransferase CheR
MEQEIYSQIKFRIKKVLNIDLNYYKDEQMRRRLDSWLARSQVGNWNDYFLLVSKNSDELTRFRNYLTINVTEFFRDPERWQMLRQTLMPDLFNTAYGKNGRNSLRVWSAGCSIGIEAYTLAILLDELARSRPYSILATDLDRGALQVARARGPYKVEETQNLSVEQRTRYLDLQPGTGYFVKSSLARPIQFAEQDLNADRFDTGFDLIVCRNVIIYFTNEAKLLLYQKFHAALRPGGVLFLGGTEIIPSPKEIGFRNQGYSFYIKG